MYKDKLLYSYHHSFKDQKDKHSRTSLKNYQQNQKDIS